MARFFPPRFSTKRPSSRFSPPRSSSPPSRSFTSRKQPVCPPGSSTYEAKSPSGETITIIAKTQREAKKQYKEKYGKPAFQIGKVPTSAPDKPTPKPPTKYSPPSSGKKPVTPSEPPPKDEPTKEPVVMSRLEAAREWVKQYGPIPKSGTRGIKWYKEGVKAIQEGKAPVKGYGAKVGIYEVKTDKGIKKFEAIDADQAKRKAESYGLDVTGDAKKVGDQKLSIPQAQKRIKTAAQRSKLAAAEAVITYKAALGKEYKVPEGSVPVNLGVGIGMGYLSPEMIEGMKALPFYDAEGKGTEQDKLSRCAQEFNALKTIKLPNGDKVLKRSVKAQDGSIIILGWDDISERYRTIAETKGVDVMYAQMSANRTVADTKLNNAGFREEVPKVYMQAAGSPFLREFTVPNMAQFVRDNPDGMQILENYGFSQEVLDTVKQFNKEALSLVNYINQNVKKLSAGEALALKRALNTVGKLEFPSDMAISDIVKRFPVETTAVGLEEKTLSRFWQAIDKDTKVAVALLFDKDYTKVSHISSISKDLQHISAENLASQIILGPAVAVMTPIGKKLTLGEAKTQLSKDYKNELTALASYVSKKDGTFDVTKLAQDLKDKPDLETSVLDNTGYKDSEELVGSLEYYNYGTTVTSKEWAFAGLTLGLVAIPFAGKALSTLGVLGKLIKLGVPTAIAGVMMPDVIRLMKDKDVSVANKVFVAGIVAALLSGAVWATGKFAFRELRQFARPGTFEASGVSLEVSIPRVQLRANMTPKIAQTLVADLEKAWGTTLPDEMIKAIGKFKTPADFQVWASAVVRQGVMSTHIKGVAGDIALGGIKGRANPLQASLKNNVLFSVKPDMQTYGAIIGKSKTGIDITPAGSMEWWSPNFSGDVAGWYLGKVKQFVPGGKMLRFSLHDIKSYPSDIFVKVANQMQNPKIWAAVKSQARGDNVTAMNILVQREVYRRALLSPKNPQALPSGIYPVFKFHWSKEPSGQLRPTWELEMITPAGFSARTFKPTGYLDKFQTGGKGTPTVAALTVRSPIEGRDFVSGQRIRLGQPMPVVIQATKQALAEGKGLPTLRELYAAKYYYRPIAAVQNIFSRGKLVRPRATEASMVTTPQVWRSRVIKFDKLKANPSDVAAKRALLKMSAEERMSTASVASKIEGHRPDAQGRFMAVRDPYYHPIREYADNWVTPRVGVMVKHPTIQGAYIVGTDTSSAAQPGVWGIIGGQIDARGKTLLKRPFGRISIKEAGIEQFMSETGVGLRNVESAAIHLGKGTEHSAYGMYVVNGVAKSTNFKIPINKWYDMVKGEWVLEPELSAIGVLQSGQRAAVTPTLYVELARRGFNVRNLVVVDIGLPTSGVRQYVVGTFEYNTLRNANIYRPWEIGGIGKRVAQIPKNEALIKAKGIPVRIQSFQKVSAATSPEEFVVATSYRSPVYTGLVPTLRPPLSYAPTVVVERTTVSKLPLSRISPERTDMQTLFPPSYILTTPRTNVKSYEVPRVTVKTRKPILKTYTPTRTTTTTRIPTRIPSVVTYTPILRPARGKSIGGLIPRKAKKGKRQLTLGSITWRQGSVWKAIRPPWRQEKPITLREAPIGAVNISEKTPAKTIQMIGKPKARVPESVSVDLGVVDILIKKYGKSISFTGKGLETVAGSSIAGTTKGMSIPATAPQKVKEVRAKGAEGYKKLAFGTSTRSLVAETYNTAMPKAFADRTLSGKLSKLSPREIATEIAASKVSKERKAEILKMLPDRVRRQVELWLSLATEYAPTRGMPKVLYQPTILRRKKKLNKKVLTEKEVMPSASAIR